MPLADDHRWPSARPIDVVVDGRVVCLRRHAGAPGETPLLLIHGIACSSEAWGPLLEHWADAGETRPAVAADMPGYGRSEAPPRALDMPALGDWQARLLDVLGHPRVHVVGHSMGCQVALALARRHPERVASCTLIGPTTGDRHEGLTRYALGLAADSLAETLAWNRTLTRMAMQMGARRYLATLRHFLRDHPIALADAVACPVLVVRGRRDWIVPAAVARRLADAVPRGRYAVVPVGAHAVQFTAPATLWAAVRPFLAAADGRVLG